MRGPLASYARLTMKKALHALLTGFLQIGITVAIYGYGQFVPFFWLPLLASAVILFLVLKKPGSIVINIFAAVGSIVLAFIGYFLAYFLATRLWPI